MFADKCLLQSPLSEATNTPEPPSMDSSFILQRPPSTRDASQTRAPEGIEGPADSTIPSQRPDHSDPPESQDQYQE